MTIRKILIEPDPLLRKTSVEVDKVDSKIQQIMDDMLETMYDAPGIGLAAIQIGIPKRIIVIDLAKEGEKKNPLFIVNPQIVFKSDNEATYEEGCLSIPGQFAKIQRPEKCTIKFLDYEGKEKEIKTEGLLATCIQHEIDHLNGILFIDHLSKLKREIILKKAIKEYSKS